jgi:uncharacterized GH25 family protein
VTTIRIAAVLSLAIPASFAHFAWLETDSTLTVGKSATIKIGYGHEVTKSESAVSTEGLKLWAIDPAGMKTELRPVASGDWVVAEFTPKAKGAYRFVMTQDRGVLSQTTKGFKPGGRDVHPDAKKSMKLWRSATVHASTPGEAVLAGAPLQLPLEVLMDRKPGEVHLTVLREGQPMLAAEVSLNVVGSEDTVPVGKTNPDGKLVLKQGSLKGPALYVVSLAEPAAKDANYDTNNFTSVVEVTW